MFIVVFVAPDTATPVGAGSEPPPPPPEPVPDETWSTIALIAAICVPAFCAKFVPYQPIQSQQPLLFASEPLAEVGCDVLSTFVCGNSTMMLFVSAHRVMPVFLMYLSPMVS